MANTTIRTYTGDGATTIYPIDFTLGYISREYVFVYLTGDTFVTELDYTWLNNSQIELTTAPAVGIEFNIRRVVPRNELVNDFVDGAILREKNLDDSFKQTLMALEEIGDGFATASGDFIINSDLDMRGFRIKNLPAPSNPTDPLRLQDAGLISGDITLRDLTTSTTTDTVISITGANDNDMIIIQSAAPVVITLETTTVDTVVFFMQDTVQQVTFVAGAGAVIKTPLGLAPYTQNSICFAYSINSTTWVLGGDLG